MTREEIEQLKESLIDSNHCISYLEHSLRLAIDTELPYVTKYSQNVINNNLLSIKAIDQSSDKSNPLDVEI